MRFVFVFFIMLFTFSVNADYIQSKGIEVTGRAVVNAVPDVFTLNVTILERGSSAGKIKALVDHKSNRVVDSVILLGIKSTDIESSQVNIYPIYDQEYQKPSIQLKSLSVKKQFSDNEKGKIRLEVNKKSKVYRAPVIEVSRIITVKLFDIAVYDKLLDKIVKIGVNKVSPLQMSFSNHENLYQQALDKAVLAAKPKAMRVAAKAGVTLGRLVYMKELSSGGAIHYSMANRARVGFNSNVGVKGISAQITATFQLER